MCHFYYLLSQLKQLDFSNFSQNFGNEAKSFTNLTRSANSVVCEPQGQNLWSIMIEKREESSNILMNIGHILEKALTLDKSDFQRLRAGAENPLKIAEDEAYVNCKVADFLLRSQIDCYDPRLPKKTFDLKTRASLPIRMDIENYKNYLNYKPTQLYGKFASYERELYDVLRSALLKYNFQVRIGNMDGIFLCYHNTAEIFGFQYLSREEMDGYIYGNSLTGDAAFKLILQLYSIVLNTILPKYKQEEKVILTFSIGKTASSLQIYSQSFVEEDDPKRPPGERFPNLKQHVLTTSSRVNNANTPQVILSEEQDVWQVTYSLVERTPVVNEYAQIRQIETEEIKRESLLIREIKQSYLGERNDPTSFHVGNWAYSHLHRKS